MEVIKILNESTPLAEAMDAERVVVAQEGGQITLVYLNSDKIISVQLGAVAVQVEIHKDSIYVSTKPFAIEITKENEESEEVYKNNALACKKTGSKLWEIDILEDSLVVSKTFDKAGGFIIHADKLYVCNILSLGFYVLSLGLDMLETVAVQIEPSASKPWYSNIAIIDNNLFLTQEESRIRWFTVGDKIEERGIVEPEFIHETSFISINAAPKKLVNAGEYILGIVASGEPYVIEFVNGIPVVAVDPETIFTLNYKEKSAVLNRVHTRTDQYVLAMDRYRIIVSDTKLETVLHGFCLDETDETLNLTRLTVFGNYVLCFAWTYGGKNPLIILDVSKPKAPVIIKIIDCGVTSGAIKVDVDE